MNKKTEIQLMQEAILISLVGDLETAKSVLKYIGDLSGEGCNYLFSNDLFLIVYVALYSSIVSFGDITIGTTGYEKAKNYVTPTGKLTPDIASEIHHLLDAIKHDRDMLHHQTGELVTSDMAIDFVKELTARSVMQSSSIH